MPRRITIEFVGGLRLLRAMTYVLAAGRIRHSITIEKTTGKALHREVHYPDRVRVRAFRDPGSPPPALREV